MNFNKYQHVEKLGHRNVKGIETGSCHIFPKLDGTNGSIWKDEEGIQCGSRNRKLSEGKDNHGFWKHVNEHENYKGFFAAYPNLRLFGEWLVPHTLKTYADDAWRKFYIFDVTDSNGKHIHYDDYQGILLDHWLEFVPCMRVIRNPDLQDLHRCLEENKFLIKDGEGSGEGIVIKNYDFTNIDGRQNWAKIVTNEFKGKHQRDSKPPTTDKKIVEDAIIDEFCTEHFIRKEFAKIESQYPDGFENRMIPELLGRIYYEFIVEESWSFIKKHKNPIIDYRRLQQLMNIKIKETLTEIF